MPIYAYACKQCNHEFDALQKVSDAPLTDCPECGEPALKRLLSAPRFRLKGQGWYETDFKTGGKKNLAGEDKAGNAGSGAGGAASSGAADGGASTDSKSGSSKSDNSAAAG